MIDPQTITSDWTVAKMQSIIEETEDSHVIEMVIELLAAICPTKGQDKFKYEAAWAAIDEGYRATDECRNAARKKYAT